MSFTNSQKKNPESNLENKGEREWVPSSYPTYMELSDQKCMNMMREVRRCTICLEKCSQL
jgi:hypothetical protein